MRKQLYSSFFPLIEHHINERLSVIRGAVSPTTRQQVAVLMDEPELHLHPNLQGKVLDYELFKRHLHGTGMSKEIFIYACAREASERQSVSRFVTALFATLGISPTLDAAGS